MTREETFEALVGLTHSWRTASSSVTGDLGDARRMIALALLADQAEPLVRDLWPAAPVDSDPAVLRAVELAVTEAIHELNRISPALPPGIFLRTLLLRTHHDPASVPAWAAGRACIGTVGPFTDDREFHFWVDSYEPVPGISFVRDNSNVPLLLVPIDPKPAAGEFPEEIRTRYSMEASFRQAPSDRDEPVEWTIRPPVAARPVQTPRLVSAGFASSPFVAAPDYSSTGARDRMLWLEFEGPPADPGDRYFARRLACGPDPLLLGEQEQIPERSEPPLPIDPELIRIVTPGQSADATGLDAMQELVPSTDPAGSRHFLVPLPPGMEPESAELFGFFAYEVRLGHDDSRWSTAQARFGPPLRVTGVQHPAPPLICRVHRTPDTINVDAPYATPVFEGRNLRPRMPNTEIWALLYAQVVQADGRAFRNVLLDRARAVPLSEARGDARHDANFHLVEQTRREVLLNDIGTAAERHVLAAGCIPRLGQRGLDAIRDKVEHGTASQGQRLASVMSEHKHGVLERRMIAPPPLTRILAPWAPHRAEHVTTHDRCANVLRCLPKYIIVNPGLTVVRVTVLRAKGPGRLCRGSPRQRRKR